MITGMRHEKRVAAKASFPIEQNVDAVSRTRGVYVLHRPAALIREARLR